MGIKGTPDDKADGLKHVGHSVIKLYQTVKNAYLFNNTVACQ